MATKKATTIVVTGDVTIDWNIASIQRTDAIAHAWNTDDVTRACYQPGGAAMLTGLIKAVADRLLKSEQRVFDVRSVAIPRASVRPGDERYHHSYAMWSLYDNGKSGKKGQAWRVQKFLGLNRANAAASSYAPISKVVNDPAKADIIILDDAGLGFREVPDYWPRALSAQSTPAWIIVKMARPVASGKLWEHLQEYHTGRLIVVMTANDLRRTEVHISRGVSWERTAQDLVWELIYNPQVNSLIRCAHVVVSFDTAGAVLLSRRSDGSPAATLAFDPQVVEGSWGTNHKGHMIGYTSCLSAGIAGQVMANPGTPDLIGGIQSGISAMRTLHIAGYGRDDKDPQRIQLNFPTAAIAEALETTTKFLAVAPITNPVESLKEAVQPPRFWTILQDQYTDSLEQIAHKIVLEGLASALHNVPIGKFGNLVTVDRQEIEALHSIGCLISEYCNRPQERPLSIAVFGPPGSGKSFAVKQVAHSIRPGEIATLTFNLSQLDGPADLYDALHRVRDVGLSGKMPLVFWDEFDAELEGQPLGWLRYFLAPMQDGEFQQGQIIHPTGSGIFVFAGGTSHRMEGFGENLDEKIKRAVKLPDFVSRLKGFLNILGPNPQKNDDDSGDPYYIIRRAILLRSMFERTAPQLFRSEGGKRILNIDAGLTCAFLLTQEYKHGARSMESILAMSQLAGKTGFERSALPSETQMNLHVDGRDFLALMQRLNLEGEVLEKLARSAHEILTEHLKSRGYSYGEVTSDANKTHSSLKPFEELPEDEKEQNRGTVRDIVNKLAATGHVMMPARSHDARPKFSTDIIEKLAILEHERWVKTKREAGWEYAKVTDKHKKLHSCLVEWDALPETEKEKDRVFVRGISAILAKAGYTAVKLGQ